LVSQVPTAEVEESSPQSRQVLKVTSWPPPMPAEDEHMSG
jgi:hypothetical protein